MLPDYWERELEAALEEVQQVVNDELGRQFGQLRESLRDFLYELFNYPLERPWPESLAIFAEHWTDRGLKLTPRTLEAIGRLIAEELDEPEDVFDADSIAAASNAAESAIVVAAAPRRGSPQPRPLAKPHRGRRRGPSNRSSSQDPIGSAGDSSNVYRYVENGPTNTADSNGLHEITWATGTWGQAWTAAEQAIVTSSLPRIAIRVPQMMSHAAAKRAVYAADRNLSECEKDYVLKMIDKMRGVLDKVVKGIKSSAALRLYHYDLNNPGLSARTWPFFKWIAFNDNHTPPWNQLSPSAFDQLFFHELTHLYGTLDSSHFGQGLNNAHVLDMWYNGQDNLFNASGDFALRKAAKQFCELNPGTVGPLPPTP